MNDYFGKQMTITSEVQYIGDGEDPKDNIEFQAWAKALKEVYGQPERLSEKTYYRNEDGTYPHLESCIGSDSLNSMET